MDSRCEGIPNCDHPRDQRLHLTSASGRRRGETPARTTAGSVEHVRPAPLAGANVTTVRHTGLAGGAAAMLAAHVKPAGG